MSDIVERLSFLAEYSDSNCDRDGMLDAAREIERLRNAKPSIPWRKVSEEPEAGQWVAIWSRSGAVYSIEWDEDCGFFGEDTHWCYLCALKPEDAE